jgi:glycosyltransferase involved in cell wall biosynthesis
VLPVFNQETIIIRNLESILNCLTLPSELIIINDGSSDGSLRKLSTYLSKHKSINSNIVKISLLSFKYPVFETFCDSTGINYAKGKYIIEIQADMKIKEIGFDNKLIKVLEQNPDIFIVGARGIQPFTNAISYFLNEDVFTQLRTYPQKIKTVIKKRLLNRTILSATKTDNYDLPLPGADKFKLYGSAGRLGNLGFTPINFLTNKIYVGESVMRGPLCFQKSIYDQIGGLDTNSFFQGYDESDLQFKARVLAGYKSAYISIDYESPSEDRVTHTKKSIFNEFTLLLSIARVKNNKQNRFTIMNKQKINLLENCNEIRNLN